MLTVVGLVLQASEASDPFADVIITHEVRGAVAAVDKDKKSCRIPTPGTSCNTSCTGGAVRRAAFFAEIRARAASRAGLIAIDTGGFFFGSGLFFPTFMGNASQTMFQTAR